MTAAMTTDIPVATVDAARRSDREVLPEHETQYPSDDFVRALVKERYDGTASTNKAIGNELYSDIVGGTYPSWRVEQIARAMGLADEKRAEIIAKSRAADEGEQRGKHWSQPVRSLEEAQQAIAAMLPAVERDPEPEASPLTFADLPGNGAVFTLLDLLPTNGHWTSSRRRKWLAALTAVVDLLIDDEDEEAQS